MVWLTWPPPLNFRAGCRATCAVTSPLANASLYFSSVTLRLLTYVAWCLLWCSCMISALMCGSRAP
uniref:Uncharacterized protein n=1 Tax=Anguilla anguilla TaxID=7936 RepID=A0A0E9UMK1_ANGAN